MGLVLAGASRPFNTEFLPLISLAWSLVNHLSGTWYFSNFFFIVFSPLSMLFYPFPLFSLSFTPQEKTIRVLLIS